MNPRESASALGAVRRVRLWYGLFLVVVLVFGVRLFYLQIIQYSHYHQAALAQQLKDYQIPAERGLIEAYDGDKVVPIVLNQKLYTIYVDPKFIQDPKTDAQFVASVIGGDASTYEKAMTQPNRYDILAKMVSEANKDKLMAAKKPGIDYETHTYRTYPNGSLASQLLGFVNDNGQGTYGIEQVLNSQLEGKPGLLKAITDARGVPLPANQNNIELAPAPGKNVALTIDLSIQQQVEKILKQGLKNANSQSGSAIVMDPNTGAVVAMANYPTYNPADYSNVSDASVFNNTAVSAQIEPGSVMKILTTAAGLNQGVIQPDTTYQDSGSVTEDGFTITNVLPLPSSTVSIQEILIMSLNTGAVHILKEMGGGTDINSKARNIWHNYMVNHYHLGKPTGIEQSYEASGFVPDPNSGNALNLKYADTAFGQGVSMTMLQLAAAASSVLNGGTYYQPHLVDGFMDANGNVKSQPPKVLRSDVVQPKVGVEIQHLMEGVFNNNYAIYKSHVHAGYNIGGKTGTAQIPVPGGYDPNLFNGTFLGFVGGDKPQYVVVVLTKSPKLPGWEYAGSEGAAPIFGSITDMLINSGKVTPISK